MKGKSRGLVPEGRLAGGAGVGDGQRGSLAPGRMLLARLHPPQPDCPSACALGLGGQARLPSDWVSERGLRPSKDWGWGFRNEVRGAGWLSWAL